MFSVPRARKRLIFSFPRPPTINIFCSWTTKYQYFLSPGHRKSILFVPSRLINNPTPSAAAATQLCCAFDKSAPQREIPNSVFGRPGRLGRLARLAGSAGWPASRSADRLAHVWHTQAHVGTNNVDFSWVFQKKKDRNNWTAWANMGVAPSVEPLKKPPEPIQQSCLGNPPSCGVWAFVSSLAKIIQDKTKGIFSCCVRF